MSGEPVQALLRIAVWQCAPLPLDVPGNLQRIDRQAGIAKARGADLLVCPEMILTGYDIGTAAVAQLAGAADGPSAQAVSRVAQRHAIAIAYGYPERAANGAIYNAARLVSGSGATIGHCRKMHLFGELDRAMFSAGETGMADATLFELHGWRLGMAICYDIEFPETARRLALAGADLIVVPTANMAGFDIVPLTLVPARAYENQLFVAYANYCGSEASTHYGGLSCVAAPDGREFITAGREEALLLVELSRERLEASRRHIGYLRDRRLGF